MEFELLKQQIQQIAVHSDKNPVPDGEDPNQYFQAFELNLFADLLKILSNKSILKLDDIEPNADDIILGNGNYLALNSLVSNNLADRSINNAETPFATVMSNGSAEKFTIKETTLTSDGNCVVLLKYNPELIELNTEYIVSFKLDRDVEVAGLVINVDTAEIVKSGIPVTKQSSSRDNLYQFKASVDVNKNASQFGLLIKNNVSTNISELAIHQGKKQQYFYTKKDFIALLNSELPENIGLIDTEDETGNVYTKEQVNAMHPAVEVSQETIIQFRKETDYGTFSEPLSAITLDLEKAKRDVIQCVYFNGQELPVGISWLNDSDVLFQPNTTFYIILKWDGKSRIVGSLNKV